MQVINVCGFNLSGCTAVFDLLFDYQDVVPLNLQYHESGFFKCKYSFGGAIQSALLQGSNKPGRDVLAMSLQGRLPDEYRGELENPIIAIHLKSRAFLCEHLSPEYADITENVLQDIPVNADSLSSELLLPLYSSASKRWLAEILSLYCTKHELIDPIILLKNDPPGKFPYVASLIPNGLSIAVLRDPLDSCYDYNRFYKYGLSDETVTTYANMFGSWVRTAINQINRFAQITAQNYNVVRFEDLVTKSVVRDKILDKSGVGNKLKIKHTFDPSHSIKNVDLGRQLSERHKKIVRDTCVKDYDRFITLLRSKQMLVEE